MIWLTKEQHAEVLQDPRVLAADEASLALSAWAKDRGTPAAIHAAVRAQEACYWLMQDLVHELGERAHAEQNGGAPRHEGSE